MYEDRRLKRLQAEAEAKVKETSQQRKNRLYKEAIKEEHQTQENGHLIGSGQFLFHALLQNPSHIDKKCSNSKRLNVQADDMNQAKTFVEEFLSTAPPEYKYYKLSSITRSDIGDILRKNYYEGIKEKSENTKFWVGKGIEVAE